MAAGEPAGVGAATGAEGWTGKNVAHLVTAAAIREPEHPALIDDGTGATRTWGEVDAAVDAEAHRLVAAGVQRTQRVLVRLPTSAAAAVAMFGAMRSGAVLVPAGTGLIERELAAVLATSGAVAVVAEPTDATAVRVAQHWGLVRLDPPDLAASAEPFPAAGRGEDLAVLAFTSGTSAPTGAEAPRVMLPHRALLANVAQCAALRPAPVTPADRVLLALPLSHIYGLGPGLLQSAHAAATVVLVDRFDPERTLRIAAEQRISALAAVPTMFRSWLRLGPAAMREGFASVRLFTSGAAPLSPDVLMAVRAATGVDVFEGYGLTETGPVLTSNLVRGRAKPGSVGDALPANPERGVDGVQLRLVDTQGAPLPSAKRESEIVEDRGSGDRDWDRAWDDWDEPWAAWDDGDTGIVSVRGPNLFLGYWPDAAGGPNGDGWFCTGDVGYLDQDGDLHLVDRSGDLIIVNGFNVFPNEVEEVLRAFPGVAEAAAVGAPDPRTGEAVRAVLVPEAGAALPAAEVIEHCARSLARFKVPAQVSVVDELPYTPTGKIARRRLREAGAVQPDDGAGNPPAGRTVTVLTRANCPACATAEADVARICDPLGVSWVAVDVDGDGELRAEYGDRVPVILIDGAEHGYWRVEEDRFRRALAR